jgi:hypothetical protein
MPELDGPAPLRLPPFATWVKAIGLQVLLLDITILEIVWSYIAPKTMHKYSTVSWFQVFLRPLQG